MSEKTDQANANQPQGQGGGTAAAQASSGSRSNPAQRSGGNHPHGKVISGGKRQFLIAIRRADGALMPPLGFQHVALDAVEQSLRSLEDVEMVENIGSRAMLGSFPTVGSDGLLGASNVLVARMPEDKAEMLKQQSRGQLIVEPDQRIHLSHFDPEPPLVTGITAAVGSMLSTTLVVLGKDNTPVREAEVFLFGSLATASGLTDERGHVQLSLAGETVSSVRSLYVKPKSDYWSFYQPQPALDTGQPNLVILRSLADWFPEFPRQQIFGWGQRAMRLEQLPAPYRGQGIKVAVVDSGIATGHVDLQRVKSGVDLVSKRNGSTAWNQDTVSHGTHCAGIIAAAENSLGIRGFAPDAEVHACKVFPGGQLSDLVEALEYCIENQIDLVCLSLGANEPSEAMEQEIVRAKRLGVAIIAAAGNSGGPVEYPASSPNVLAVAALGKWGEFPADSYHAQTLGPLDAATGLFSPRFSCFGPQVALCAPGVAILSAVPPNNYAVRDGTSLAAAHVAGLAALILAHHVEFQGPFKARNADRVDRLFQILKASAQPVNLGDPRRTGFGLPDVPVALGLAPRLGIMPSLQWSMTQPGFFGPLQALSAFYNVQAQAGSGFGKAPFYPGAPVPVW